MNNYEHFKTLSQRQLGRLFGVSSHVIGRWLIDIGLRTTDKHPSPRAYQEGYCSTADNCRNGYYYVWDRKKTIKALEAAGHKRVNGEKEPTPEGRGLNGPFDTRKSSTNGYEIVNGDGTVNAWVIGQSSAEWLVAILNLAHRHNKLV